MKRQKHEKGQQKSRRLEIRNSGCVEDGVSIDETTHRRRNPRTRHMFKGKGSVLTLLVLHAFVIAFVASDTTARS